LLIFIFRLATSLVTLSTPLASGLFDDAVVALAIPGIILILGFTTRFVWWANTSGVIGPRIPEDPSLVGAAEE
jgi:hypothetical protein